MTYHVVFDISERFPDLVIGIVALVGLATFLILLLVLRDWKGARIKPFLWLGAGALLWADFGIHNIGGPFGILAAVFGIVFLPLVVAGNAAKFTIFQWRGGGLQARDALTVSNQSVGFTATLSSPPGRATIVAPILLALVALSGCQQISALDLNRQMSAGGGTVTTGKVQDEFSGNWAYQCFTVDGHRFCYDDGPSEIGFHQSKNNGGPIRNGLQVRVSSIGEVIVRLEIADGQ